MILKHGEKGKYSTHEHYLTALCSSSIIRVGYKVLKAIPIPLQLPEFVMSSLIQLVTHNAIHEF